VCAKVEVATPGRRSMVFVEDQIRHWLLLSGVNPWHPRLVLAIPRWRNRLRDMGITDVVIPMVSGGPTDDRVTSLLCLWVKQAMAPDARDATAEHHLRNLTGTNLGSSDAG
jgi:hypothetical protein